MKNCGPIKNLNETLDDLNLIYGLNESGKSFLVEFILRALFNDYDEWGYIRDDIGNGIVEVEIDGSTKVFRPRKGIKLDSFFINEKGLPPIISRILIVKSGEVEVKRGDECIDRGFIKDIFSQEKILDIIEKSISKTIMDVEIEKDYLSIKKMGIGRDYDDLKNAYNDIQKILDEVINEYNVSDYIELKRKEEYLSEKIEDLKKAKRYEAYRISEEIEKIILEISTYPEEKIVLLKKLLDELKDKKIEISNKEKELKMIIDETKNIQELKKKIDEMIKAKNFLAYRYSQEIEKRKRELDIIPEELINRVEIQMIELRNKEIDLNKLNKNIEELSFNTRNYEWLKSARDNYIKFSLSKSGFKHLNSLFLVIGLFLLLTGIAINERFLIFSSIILIFVGVIITMIKDIFMLSRFFDNKEIKNLMEEFKEKTGKELRSLTTIDSELVNLGEGYNRLTILKEKKLEYEVEIETLKNNIKKDMRFISGEECNFEDFYETLIRIKAHKRKIKEEIEHFERMLSLLNVKETEYYMDEVNIEYDEEIFEKLKTNLSILYKKKEDEKRFIEEINYIKDEISLIVLKIKGIYNEFGIFLNDDDDFEQNYNKLLGFIEEKKKRLIQLKERLDLLSINENDYVKVNPGIEFSQEELEKLENEREDTRKKINELENRFQVIKMEIAKITNDDIKKELPDLLENLYKKREEVLEELKKMEAEIIGKKFVYKAIKELRAEEDEKLIENLNADEIKDVIFNITGKYKEFSIEGNKIKVLSDLDEFYIKDISTGAKEQIMLGIRIGLAMRVLNEDRMFFLFDDAFQHSDYTKRPVLVETLVKLALDGWQIIYLTMDENIKEEFLKQIELKEVKKFRFIKL